MEEPWPEGDETIVTVGSEGSRVPQCGMARRPETTWEAVRLDDLFPKQIPAPVIIAYKI